MAIQTNLPGMGLPAEAAVEAYRLVKLTSSRTVEYTAKDGTADAVGVTQEARAITEIVPVRFLQSGTFRVTTDNSAITAGILVYKGANGKVSATSTGSVAVGRSMEANGSTDGVIIEVMPLQH